MLNDIGKFLPKIKGDYIMDAQKLEVYKQMPFKRLNITLTKLRKDTELIGKELPYLEGVEKEMRVKEYTQGLEEIDEIKQILKDKQGEKEVQKSETMEKLFPTVMKITHKSSGKNNIKETIDKDEQKTQKETIEEIKEEQEKIKEIIKEETKEETQEKTQTKKEFVDNKPTIVPPIREDNTKNITELSRSAVNKKDSNWLTIDDFIESDITEPKEQEIIIEPLIPQKPFNGDLSTDVLASTEDELLSSPLIVITEDLVKNMSADDRLREKYRMDNFKRVLLRSLNKVEKGSEKRKEIIHKITVAESNLSAILKYS